MKVGVLALQGAFDAHVQRLNALGADVSLVRRACELEGVDGLIMPGGESTTMLRHLEREQMFDALATFVHTHPCFGTCAGSILLADTVTPTQRSLGAIPISVARNAYGRQLDSTVLLAPSHLGEPPLEMVFIRAPRITQVGEGVEVLAEREGDPVLVRKGHVLVSTFHPELSDDTRVHRLFLKMVASSYSAMNI